MVPAWRSLRMLHRLKRGHGFSPTDCFGAQDGAKASGIGSFGSSAVIGHSGRDRADPAGCDPDEAEDRTIVRTRQSIGTRFRASHADQRAG